MRGATPLFSTSRCSWVKTRSRCSSIAEPVLAPERGVLDHLAGLAAGVGPWSEQRSVTASMSDLRRCGARRPRCRGRAGPAVERGLLRNERFLHGRTATSEAKSPVLILHGVRGRLATELSPVRRYVSARNAERMSGLTRAVRLHIVPHSGPVVRPCVTPRGVVGECHPAPAPGRWHACRAPPTERQKVTHPQRLGLHAGRATRRTRVPPSVRPRRRPRARPRRRPRASSHRSR